MPPPRWLPSRRRPPPETARTAEPEAHSPPGPQGFWLTDPAFRSRLHGATLTMLDMVEGVLDDDFTLTEAIDGARHHAPDMLNVPAEYGILVEAEAAAGSSKPPAWLRARRSAPPSPRAWPASRCCLSRTNSSSSGPRPADTRSPPPHTLQPAPLGYRQWRRSSRRAVPADRSHPSPLPTDGPARLPSRRVPSCAPALPAAFPPRPSPSPS
jgi:hypothetical protein